MFPPRANSVCLQQFEQIRAQVRRQRRLQRRGAKRIQPHDLECVGAPGERGIELEHRARDTNGGVLRQHDKQALRKALARPAHDDVGLADQALGGQPELVQGGAIHQEHRGAESHAQRDCQQRDDETAGLFAQLGKKQNAPRAPSPCIGISHDLAIPRRAADSIRRRPVPRCDRRYRPRCASA
jgi:hypothetical protein